MSGCVCVHVPDIQIITITAKNYFSRIKLSYKILLKGFKLNVVMAGMGTTSGKLVNSFKTAYIFLKQALAALNKSKLQLMPATSILCCTVFI